MGQSMSKTQWYVIVAALILIGVGGWVKGARSVQIIAPASTTQIDTLGAMSTASKELPSPQYDLY